jgi:hypothetical protein
MMRDHLMRLAIIVIGALLVLNLVNFGLLDASPAFGKKATAYKVVNLAAGADELTNLLNEAASEGWEFGATTGVDSHGWTFVILKK